MVAGTSRSYQQLPQSHPARSPLCVRRANIAPPIYTTPSSPESEPVDVDYSENRRRRSTSGVRGKKGYKNRKKRNGGASRGKEKKRHVRPGKCANCGTTDTPMWRINGLTEEQLREDEDAKICNACGIHFSTHGEVRPPSLWKHTPTPPSLATPATNLPSTSRSPSRKASTLSLPEPRRQLVPLAELVHPKIPEPREQSPHVLLSPMMTMPHGGVMVISPLSMSADIDTDIDIDGNDKMEGSSSADTIDVHSSPEKDGCDCTEDEAAQILLEMRLKPNPSPIIAAETISSVSGSVSEPPASTIPRRLPSLAACFDPSLCAAPPNLPSQLYYSSPRPPQVFIPSTWRPWFTPAA